MPSTYTPNLGLERPQTGEQAGEWGNTANARVFDLIDEAVYSIRSIALSDANATLTLPNGTTSPNRGFVLKFTGTLSAERTITLPPVTRRFEIDNQTSGGFALLVKTPTSGTVRVPAGSVAIVYAEGSSIRLIGTQAIALTSESPPSGAPAGSFWFDPVRLTLFYNYNDGNSTQWVIAVPNGFGLTQEDADGRYLRRTGGTLSGALSISVGGLSVVGNTAVAGQVTINNALAYLNLNRPNDTGECAIYGRQNGLNRWAILTPLNGAAGDFALARYNDAGVQSGTPIYISRATGAISLGGNVSVTGSITATGNISTTSDRRLKRDISEIEGALEKVCWMRGVSYTDPVRGMRRIGVIAQEVQAVVPEVVGEEGGYLNVAYGNLVGLLIEAVKDLAAMNADLAERVAKLEARE
ncbi:hypothetical protein [Planktothrix phage Pra-JY27]|nr:tail spike protein [Planktothrix phage Pag-Yong1]WEV89198.1 tail fiber domain-containing protein [Synechococcus phage MinM2]